MAGKTLFFYDLETSGINPREQRIMQFAGQRTDMDLRPIGEPINQIIKLTEDVLPEPDAILVTGITPQKTLSDGVTEAEFLRLFYEQVAIPNTVFVGYNTLRFDDEFMRYLNYRNFYDPYEWHWVDGKSRWDLLDVVRMTRALRPEGISWPFTSDGQPTNRLELLTELNDIEHRHAHDAMSDVTATIELAQLIRRKQPRLFEYLFKMRSKSAVEDLVTSGEPFVYSSGKYPSETEKTTVAIYVCDNPKSGALVYDLRHDPRPWLSMTPKGLVEAWRWKKDKDEPRLPVKTLQYNRCPAVAPLTVLDDASKQRLKLDLGVIETNKQLLLADHDFASNLVNAVEILNREQQLAWVSDDNLVDSQLYDGFFSSQDKTKMSLFRAAMAEGDVPTVDFSDKRLTALTRLYKARNFPGLLSSEDHVWWDECRLNKLTTGQDSSRAAKFFTRLNQLSQTELSKDQQYLLEELKLYAESIL